MKNQRTKKWSFDQIEILIDAYKELAYLCEITQVNYQNKHLSKEAFERILYNMQLIFFGPN